MNTKNTFKHDINWINIGCILGFINIIATLKITHLNIDNHYYLIFNLIVVICLLNIWKMKIWAVFTYISVYIVNQSILILLNQWTLFQAIIPIIVIIIILINLKKMN